MSINGSNNRFRAGYRSTSFTLFLCASLLLIFPFITQAAETPSEEEQEVLIGVRANRGSEQSIKRWQATADYLSDTLPGYRFRLLPFEINSALNQAASREEFDFVLTNPASYVELEMRYGCQRLLTLINKRNGKGYTQFGSVIFTRSDRHDIQTIKDLKGKSFMGADEQGFGGWRVAWRELLLHGIDPYRDFSQLRFGGGIQQNVVSAVASGEVDAGSVRTDLLEGMADAGKIQWKDFKVIGIKQTRGFAFIHSTDLYPEWPFAKLAHADDVLAEKVAAALVQIKHDSPAAINGKYIGWHTALDYQPVDDLLRELHAGPYARYEYITLTEIITDYWHIVLLSILVLSFILIMLMRLKILNKQLQLTEQGLLASNEKLRDMAVVDGLTGVGNRRKLDDFLAFNWGRVCRSGNPVCVMMLDIDYFKDYNDTYGHIAGDECLKKVASTIDHLYRRSNELVIRYGGEEFLIMVVNCLPGEIHLQAEILRQEIENLHIEHRTSKVNNVITVSIGVVSLTPTKDAVAEELILAADQALYQAKHAGRNRIHTLGK